MRNLLGIEIIKIGLILGLSVQVFIAGIMLGEMHASEL